MDGIIKDHADALKCTSKFATKIHKELLQKFKINSFDDYSYSNEPIADMIMWNLYGYSYEESLDGNFTSSKYGLIKNYICGHRALSSSAFTKLLSIYVDQRICGGDDGEGWPVLSLHEFEQMISGPIEQELFHIVNLYRDLVLQTKEGAVDYHALVLEFQRKHIPIAFGFTNDRLIHHQVQWQEYRTSSGRPLKLGKDLDVLLYKLEDEETIFHWIKELGLAKDLFNTIALIH